MISAIGCRYFRRAFGWCVPIGSLGGLTGLGGGEFRLPLLMYGIGFDARSAVPLNLLISLVTLAFALIVRSQTTSIVEVAPHLPEMAGLLAGGMVSAFFGASLVSRLSNARLVRLVAAFLAILGLLMIAESFLPLQTGDLLTPGFGTHFVIGLVVGIGIGLVSSVLGVAGGELLIPTLILVFGSDVKNSRIGKHYDLARHRGGRALAVLASWRDPDSRWATAYHHCDGRWFDRWRHARRVGCGLRAGLLPQGFSWLRFAGCGLEDRLSQIDSSLRADPNARDGGYFGHPEYDRAGSPPKADLRN
jgi:hypothetical protein